jgi:SpoVK/Ycf46/Vps4 family AAA+-type ATPase
MGRLGVGLAAGDGGLAGIGGLRVLCPEKLFTEYGFGAKMGYGRALSAMFSGPSGTGKTMVAGLIARDLGVELYRVDLSRVVSKYIGETEERLGALFHEAGQVGAALLFDEGDALFGQRTEIKSSNDRYANLEVNYLLQRLEEFDGVVILTTNFATSIDEAFVRRIRFRVQFPFPTPKDRARLWDVMMPPELPVDDDGLDLDWMGESFELSGGHIRNAVLRAGLLAADADRPLTMRMLYEAAAAEYRELGKLAPPYAFDDEW